MRALEVSRQIKNFRLLWSVAAALVILVGGVSLWHLRQETKGAKEMSSRRQASSKTPLPQSDLNVIALTRLALEDHEHFEAVLADKSRSALPSFQTGSSTLQVLAKE